MTVQADIAAVLAADDDLMEILTGGVYTQDDVSEISRQTTPDAFDANGELEPCALIAEGTETPRGGIDHPNVGIAVQTSVNIYYYERSGYENIAAAMDLAFSLLRGQKIGSGTWRVEYDNTIKNQEDQALKCPLGVQRFTVVRRRA
jgi:hypothetical protein